MRRLIPIRTILLFVLLVTAVVIPFVLWEESITAWTKELFAQCDTHPVLVAGALFVLLALDLFLPVPSCLVGIGFGITLGFGWGVVASFLAMMFGGVLGYVIGRVSQPLAKRLIGDREMEMLMHFQQAYGDTLLLALRPVPILAEASTLFAGMGRVSPLRMAVYLSIGNLLVSVVNVGIGAWGNGADAMLPAFAATAVLSGLSLLWAHGRHAVIVRRSAVGK